MEDQANRVRFDFESSQLEILCKKELEVANQKLTQIGSVSPSVSSIERTLLPLEATLTSFLNSVEIPIFLKYVSSSPSTREAAGRCEAMVSKFFVDVFAREDLFEALRPLEEQAIEDPTVARLLDEYLSEFRRSGLELDPKIREVFVKKRKRLIELENEFSKNLIEYSDSLEIDEKQLEGLSEDYIKRLGKTPEGRFIVTLAYPDYKPFMENSKDASARRKLNQKYFQRGGKRNIELLEEAIELRHELAQLLGFPNHAAYVLDRVMAKTPERVTSFLESLKSKLVEKGSQELKALLELKREECGDPRVAKIESWDRLYYENLLKKRKYRVDHQLVQEYFPLDKVLKGMFEIYETLLGVKFVPSQELPVWHDSVKLFSVNRKGETAAYFYMDLFPREGKYEHAAAFTLRKGYLGSQGKYIRPVSAIVANFNPPSSGKKSLLPHSDVETLFHEFGHIMHQILTRSKYGMFSGTSVKRDFVEAPSQMLENWVWSKEALQKMSGHYSDLSRPLPDDLLEALLKSKLANVGLHYLRQLFFATLDMTFHTHAKVDSTAVYKELSRTISLTEIPEGTYPQASFGHLMGGYDAGYYGYLWSEVYAQDMFTRFEQEGILNPKTGADYLKWILEPGGAQDPSQLIEGFLGRAPNEKAFLRSIGVGI